MTSLYELSVSVVCIELCLCAHGRSWLGFIQSGYFHLWTMCPDTPESGLTCQQVEASKRLQLDRWTAAGDLSIETFLWVFMQHTGWAKKWQPFQLRQN